MVFYDNSRNVPRDPSAIERHAWNGDGVPSTVFLLLVVAIVLGLFYLGTQFVSRVADKNAGPAITQPVIDPTAPPTPTTQHEETRPTQAPIR
jgi:hypothetical protein